MTFFIVVLTIFLTACGATKTTPSANARAAGFNVELGMRYLKQGDVPRAKAKLLLAMSQAPHWPPALNAMAYFLEHTGDPQMAKKYYLKALKIDPQAGSTQNNYGAFLCRQGDYRQSIPYFMRAVSDEKYENTAEAYENAGWCAMLIPDNQQAALYFQKSLLQDPHRANAARGLAKISQERGH